MPVIFVLDIFRQFLGTTAYSLGVTNAVPMLKGVAFIAHAHNPYCTFRTLFRPSEAIFEEPRISPKRNKRGAGATYRPFPVL